jgi:hypothetical protein
MLSQVGRVETVLANDIANNTELRTLYRGIEKVQRKIALAQKFNLAADFALVSYLCSRPG